MRTGEGEGAETPPGAQVILTRGRRRSATVHGGGVPGATACRWATYGRRAPERLIVWGSDVPPDLKSDVLKERIAQGMDLTLVLGTSDEYITPKIVARERDRLANDGIGYRLVTYEGGHSIDPATLQAVASGAEHG